MYAFIYECKFVYKYMSLLKKNSGYIYKIMLTITSSEVFELSTDVERDVDYLFFLYFSKF